MTGAPARLDLDKLRKVRALMTRGATAGERQAARTKAEAVAARAGLTLGKSRGASGSVRRRSGTGAGGRHEGHGAPQGLRKQPGMPAFGALKAP